MSKHDRISVRTLTVWTGLLLCLTLIIGCGSTPDSPSGADASVHDDEPLDADAEGLPPLKDGDRLLLQAETQPSYSLTQVPEHPDVTGDLKIALKRDWDYIVVHHSSTRRGSKASFDRHHREKRGWLGVGYHFVIGNGRGSPDGKVEVTFRWERQLHGAHAGVDKYNQHGIGICLVGDFQESYPSQKQIASLAALVNYLQDRCKIPTSRILLHRHVKNTKCPGENFPFYRFISMLEH